MTEAMAARRTLATAAATRERDGVREDGGNGGQRRPWCRVDRNITNVCNIFSGGNSRGKSPEGVDEDSNNSSTIIQ